LMQTLDNQKVDSSLIIHNLSLPTFCSLFFFTCTGFFVAKMTTNEIPPEQK
jgi:hypothetical protein